MSIALMSEPAIPILVIRGLRVILDADLAQLYGVRTGALNQAVKRNSKRFPAGFVFHLSIEETEALRCQSDTSSATGEKASQIVTAHRPPNNRSQIVSICLAPKARRYKQPGATPQGFVQRQTASAESAIHAGSNLCGTDGEPVR